MRSMRQRLAAVVLLSGLTTLGLGVAAGPASAAVDEYCLPVLGDPANGSLQITTTPAAGSNVEPGSSIDVTGSWDAHDFEETDRFVVCGTVDGSFVEAMSLQDKSLDNDGQQSATIAVPASVASGSDVCLYGVVKGRLITPGPDVTNHLMVSEPTCFRAGAAVTTTTTTTTTAPAIVEPKVEEAGTTTDPLVEAAPAPVEPPAPLPVLPRTGAGIDVLAGLGGFALAAGGAARFLGRRR
jgi:hypothetical protein